MPGINFFYSHSVSFCVCFNLNNIVAVIFYLALSAIPGFFNIMLDFALTKMTGNACFGVSNGK